MAIAFVQNNSADDGGSGVASHLSCSFMSSVTNGNDIIVTVTTNASPFTISDNQGNTYVLDLTLTVLNGGIYRASNVVGGSVTVTIAFSGSVYISMSIAEFSGISNLTPVDATNSNISGGTNAYLNIPTTLSGDLLIGFCAINLGGSQTYTPTHITNVLGQRGSGSQANYFTGYAIVGLPASYMPAVAYTSAATHGFLVVAYGVGMGANLEAGKHGLPRTLFIPTVFNKRPIQRFYSNESIPYIPPDYSGGIPSFVGRYTPTVFNKQNLRNLKDSKPGIYTEVDTHHSRWIPCFKPTAFNKSVFRRLRYGFNPDAPVEYENDQSGQYRIQNLSATGYLLYVGNNTPPDFNQDPAAFSATLPLSIAQPLPGEGVQRLYCVARQRDSYGCISQNSNPTIIQLTPTGPLLSLLPQPQSIFAVPNPDTTVTVLGQYPTFTMEEHPANYVQAWFGTSPPVASGVPAYQAQLTNSPWNINFGSFSPGIYYITIRYYRSLDGSLSPPATAIVLFPQLPNAPTAVFTDRVTP